MKCLRCSVLFALVSEIIIVSLLLWLYTRPGFAGLVSWESVYGTLFRETLLFLIIPALLLCICILQLIFPALPFIKNKRAFFIGIQSALCILSGLSAICVLCIVGRFSYLGNRIPPEHEEIYNLLDAGESLPARDPQNTGVPLLHVALSSDPHWGAPLSSPADRTAVLRQISRTGYDAFFILGDIGERGDTYRVYDDACNDINSFIPNIPVRLIMGNHDAAVAASPRFRSYFYGRKSAPLSYRIDGGSVHFLVLNLLWDTKGFSDREEKWLEWQLQHIPEDDTVIVLSHCFFLSSGYVDTKNNTRWYDLPSMIEKFTPLFEKYHVDLVVSGHNHLMDLLQKNGVTYAVCGAMGGNLDDTISYVSPYDLWHDNTHHGYIDAVIYPKKINLIFYSSDKTVLEKYTIDTTPSDITENKEQK